jgi:hypothetical protein
MSRLVVLISRYDKAIQADLLQVYGLDLGTEWRERRWQRLLDLIDELPRTSRFRELIAQDEELARIQAEADWAARKTAKKDPVRESALPLREWSPEVDMLAGVFDRLGGVISSLYASRGIKNAPKFKPLKRPETAYERLMRRFSEQEKQRIHESIIAAVLPNRSE